MTWLGKLVKSTAALLVLLVLVGYALPDRRLVERQRFIDRQPAQIWPLLAEPRQWARWSPWHARDPQMVNRYSGPAVGLGARWSWDSALLGRGQLHIDAARAPTYLGYAVDFAAQGGAARGEFRLNAVAGGTQVSWQQESVAGPNVLLRWLRLITDHRLGREFEVGLDRLAAIKDPV